MPQANTVFIADLPPSNKDTPPAKKWTAGAEGRCAADNRHRFVASVVAMDGYERRGAVIGHAAETAGRRQSVDLYGRGAHKPGAMMAITACVTRSRI